MSKKTIEDELGDLDQWDGAFQVRHRWVEHPESRRHEHEADREDRSARRKTGRGHPPAGPKSRPT